MISKNLALLFVLLLSASSHGAVLRTLNATAILNGSGQLKIPSSTPTASRACVFDVSSIPSSSSVTSSELAFLSGVTSSVQSQINAKEPTITSAATTTYYRGDKSFQTLNTGVVPESGNLYYTDARVDTEFDIRLALKTTTDLAEGANLYYTTGRFDTALATKSTSNLTEGSNLYFTNARVDTEFDTRLATKTTSNLTEGSNLYYTDARVGTFAKNGMTAQQFYVSKDTGSDSTGDGSLLKPYRTIGAAITAANLISAYYKQTNIHVSPSSGGTGSGYVENITLSQQGVNLICDNAQPGARGCFITGTVTVNLTGTSGGVNYAASANEAYMNSFVVSTTGASNSLTFSGTQYQKFVSINNYFDANSGNSASVTNSGTNSQITSFDTNYSNGSATVPTISITSAARFWVYGTTSTVANGNAAGPSVTQSGAASSAIFNLVQLTGQYNLTDNTATASFNLSTIASGTNPCIVTPSSANTGYVIISYFGCNSTNTNSITGSGVVVNSPANIRISSSGDIVSTVTQTSFPGLPQGSVLIGNKAPSATNVILSVFDGHIKASQTTAATAVVSANAGTSGTCTLTNGRDHSGVINLTTGSGSWASGTQCTLTFNKAFATAPNCVLSPRNALGASKHVTQQIFHTTTTTTLLLAFGAADTAANAMQFWYTCLEP